MKTKRFSALLSVLAAGVLLLPLTACFTIEKKDPPKEEPKKTQAKPADGALGK